MRTVSYWDLDEDEPLGCDACSWRGRVADCGRELFDALMELECPNCSRRLLRVDFPTDAETTDAAARRRPGAAAEALRRAEADARWSRILRDPADLPDLDGDDLRLEWDFERTAGDEDTTIIRHAGTEIWREPAFWEGDTRFEDVFDLLHRRYGDRLASLTPTPRSELWLDGDQLRSRREREERLATYRGERDVRRSFVAGYLERDATPFIGQRAQAWPAPDAFRAGWELSDAERLAYSADSPSELERDERYVEEILTRITDRYGASVIESARRAWRDRSGRVEPQAAPQAAAVDEQGGTFHVIQDPGDAHPYALVMVSGGVFWWWTHEGWVDTPYFASYFLGGEPGARPIDPADLAQWKTTIQKPSPGALAHLRARR